MRFLEFNSLEELADKEADLSGVTCIVNNVIVHSVTKQSGTQLYSVVVKGIDCVESAIVVETKDFIVGELIRLRVSYDEHGNLVRKVFSRKNGTKFASDGVLEELDTPIDMAELNFENMSISEEHPRHLSPKRANATNVLDYKNTVNASFIVRVCKISSVKEVEGYPSLSLYEVCHRDEAHFNIVDKKGLHSIGDKVQLMLHYDVYGRISTQSYFYDNALVAKAQGIFALSIQPHMATAVFEEKWADFHKDKRVFNHTPVKQPNLQVRNKDWDLLIAEGMTDPIINEMQIARGDDSEEKTGQLSVFYAISGEFYNQVSAVPHFAQIKKDLVQFAGLDVEKAAKHAQLTCSRILSMQEEATSAWGTAKKNKDSELVKISELAYDEAMRQIDELVDCSRAEVGSLILLASKINEVSAAIERQHNAESLSTACGNISEYYEAKLRSQMSTASNLRAAAFLEGLREALEESIQSMYSAAKELPGAQPVQQLEPAAMEPFSVPEKQEAVTTPVAKKRWWR